MGERLEQTARLAQPRNSRAGREKSRSALALAAVLSGPLAWLLVVYVGSLSLLIVSAFFSLDDFTGKPTNELTTSNVVEAFTQSEYVSLVLRSIGVAACATVICLALALPTAFYISRLASRRTKRGLVVAMLLPLWTGYLVKAFALRAVFEPGSEYGDGGLLKGLLGWSPGFGYVAVILTLAYLWFPYMLLPIHAGFERLPDSLLDASSDLGAGTLRTFVSVIAPQLIPSIAAGSIFTFSLSLGDYITVKIVGGTAQMIGNIIERALLAPNQPLAAAFTLWPIGIMVVYLSIMGRLGAFRNL
ncbi:MAG: ABC transporter permease [Actinobacteria bacterium]|nr:ABC transporter permease [Actinomycetota bacterium]